MSGYIERTSKKGQTLLLPEYKVFSVWTDLEKVSDADILRLYRDRGTCEQYFAELKSELDLERLPSGKFSVNELFFQLGVLVNNMLRVLGESLLDSGIIGLKKAEEGNASTIAHHYAGDDVPGRTLRSACATSCREGGVQRWLRRSACRHAETVGASLKMRGGNSVSGRGAPENRSNPP